MQLIIQYTIQFDEKGVSSIYWSSNLFWIPEDNVQYPKKIRSPTGRHSDDVRSDWPDQAADTVRYAFLGSGRSGKRRLALNMAKRPIPARLKGWNETFGSKVQLKNEKVFKKTLNITIVWANKFSLKISCQFAPTNWPVKSPRRSRKDQRNWGARTISTAIWSIAWQEQKNHEIACQFRLNSSDERFQSVVRIWVRRTYFS